MGATRSGSFAATKDCEDVGTVLPRSSFPDYSPASQIRDVGWLLYPNYTAS